MDCSMPGFPVLRYFPEFAQTQVHWVSDGIHPSHLLSRHPLSLCEVDKKVSLCFSIRCCRKSRTKCWVNHNIFLIVIRRDFKADLMANKSLFSATAVEWIVVGVKKIFLAMLCGMQNLSSPTTQPVSPAGEAQSLNHCTATYFYILTDIPLYFMVRFCSIIKKCKDTCV